MSCVVIISEYSVGDAWWIRMTLTEGTRVTYLLHQYWKDFCSTITQRAITTMLRHCSNLMVHLYKYYFLFWWEYDCVLSLWTPRSVCNPLLLRNELFRQLPHMPNFVMFCQHFLININIPKKYLCVLKSIGHYWTEKVLDSSHGHTFHARPLIIWAMMMSENYHFALMICQNT